MHMLSLHSEQPYVQIKPAQSWLPSRYVKHVLAYCHTLVESRHVLAEYWSGLARERIFTRHASPVKLRGNYNLSD